MSGLITFFHYLRYISDTRRPSPHPSAPFRLFSVYDEPGPPARRVTHPESRPQLTRHHLWATSYTRPNSYPSLTLATGVVPLNPRIDAQPRPSALT